MLLPRDGSACAPTTDTTRIECPGAPNAETPAVFHLGYRRWLDGLRGVAILAVLGFHVQLVRGGNFGVDIFFVLSGFLITTLLVEEWRRRGSISLLGFYLRRGLRLLPAFLTLLIACAVYVRVFGSAEQVAAYDREIAVAACYVANWPSLHHVGMSVLGHTWSLSVEEQFYLLWPVLLYGMLRAGLRPRRLVVLVCAGILASAVLRAALFSSRPPPGLERTFLIWRLYMGLDTRADALLVGCLVGLLAGWDLLPRSRWFLAALKGGTLVAAAGLGYVLLYSCLEHHLFYYGLFTGVAFLVAVLLARLLVAPARLLTPVLESAPLVAVGRISYALYLFHIPVIHWLRPWRPGAPSPTETLLIVVLSFTAAALSYYCIERPCLRLKGFLLQLRPASATLGKV
jgi:peptidoglycan/LPS O-acetylase OafA/YrhL